MNRRLHTFSLIIYVTCFLTICLGQPITVWKGINYICLNIVFYSTLFVLFDIVLIVCTHFQTEKALAICISKTYVRNFQVWKARGTLKSKGVSDIPLLENMWTLTGHCQSYHTLRFELFHIYTTFTCNTWYDHSGLRFRLWCIQIIDWSCSSDSYCNQLLINETSSSLQTFYTTVSISFFSSTSFSLQFAFFTIFLHLFSPPSILQKWIFQNSQFPFNQRRKSL